jgi:glutathione peroxidase
MFSKIEVNGSNTCEVYKFLKAGAASGEIPWNFAKFLVDGRTGQVVKRFSSEKSPLSIEKDIKKLIESESDTKSKDL